MDTPSGLEPSRPSSPAFRHWCSCCPDQDAHGQQPSRPHHPFSDLRTWTELQSGNYTTRFPGPQTCRGQLCHCSASEATRANPIPDLSISLGSSVGSVPPGNPDQQTSPPASLRFGYVPGRGCLCGQPPGKSLGTESPVSFPE